MNVDNIGEEFEKVHNEYSRSPKLDPPKRDPNATQMRVIPIDESIEPERRVASYDEITDLVQRAGRSIGAMECVCRKYRRMEGHTCEYDVPNQSCTSFSHLAEQAIEIGVARRVTQNEALSMFADFRSRGMVLMPSATKDPMFVCSCCKDCCGALAGLRNSENPSERSMSNYYASVATEQCIACGECETRCPMNAISTESGVAAVDVKRCIGCGVCTSVCERDAIAMSVKENPVSLPEDFDDMYRRFAEMRQ